MEKFITAAGVATRYSDCGIGTKAIVLLHGYLESIEIWEDLTSELGKKYRVLAIDIPGHGISEIVGECHSMEMISDVINDWLTKIGVEKAVIVGHSMGGYIAQAFASKYPNSVAGLVLFHSSPNGDSDERKELRKREIEVIQKGRKELLATTSPGKAFAADNRRRFSNVISQMSDQVMFTEDEGIIALLRGMMNREDMNDMIDKLQVPVMFIFGKKDEYIPLAAAEAMAQRHPKVEICWLENSGHIGFVEQKEESVKALSEFTDKCYS